MRYLPLARRTTLLLIFGLLLLQFTACTGKNPSTLPQQTGQGEAAASADEALVASTYVIGVGDVLQVSVWKDAELSRQVTVLPDGVINMPLIGFIQAAGKTVTVLGEEIADRISRFMPDPILDVSVIQSNSMNIYVVGKVRNPGRFSIPVDVSVLQAMAMAGGPDKFADTGDIKIFRNEGGQTRIFKFDYDDVVAGKRLEQNILLQRGDVVVVP
ncbi:MAG: polysaccharide biosynthesis/export family protein [bacterium]|nr:polysaccharide biosynthesis/export family protein [bacterium]